MTIKQETYSFGFRKEDKEVFKKLFSKGLLDRLIVELEKKVLGKITKDNVVCSDVRIVSTQQITYTCTALVQEGQDSQDEKRTLKASFAVTAEGRIPIAEDATPDFYKKAVDAYRNYGRATDKEVETVEIDDVKYRAIEECIKEYNTLYSIDIDKESIVETIVDVDTYEVDARYNDQAFTASILATCQAFRYKEIEKATDVVPAKPLKKPLTKLEKVYSTGIAIGLLMFLYTGFNKLFNGEDFKIGWIVGGVAIAIGVGAKIVDLVKKRLDRKKANEEGDKE